MDSKQEDFIGKIEAYNKIVKNEFLAIENISNIEEGKRRYSMYVKAYNEEREHTYLAFIIISLNRTKN